jgi:hypothetical protein
MVEKPPFAYDDPATKRVRPVLQGLIDTMLAWTPRDGE